MTYGAGLTDGGHDAKGGHENDGDGVVEVAFVEPDDKAEHLEYVEGVQDLEDEEDVVVLHRYQDLVVPVHYPPAENMCYIYVGCNFEHRYMVGLYCWHILSISFGSRTLDE